MRCGGHRVGWFHTNGGQSIFHNFTKVFLLYFHNCISLYDNRWIRHRRRFSTQDLLQIAYLIPLSTVFKLLVIMNRFIHSPLDWVEPYHLNQIHIVLINDPPAEVVWKYACQESLIVSVNGSGTQHSTGRFMIKKHKVLIWEVGETCLKSKMFCSCL